MALYQGIVLKDDFNKKVEINLSHSDLTDNISLSIWHDTKDGYSIDIDKLDYSDVKNLRDMFNDFLAIRKSNHVEKVDSLITELKSRD